VCFGGKPFSAQESAILQQRDLTGRVEHKHGDDCQLAQYYRSAAALVYPSVCEGFGLPLLEAMGLSCPVFCSAIPALKEIAGEAASYFEPGSVESMKEVLLASLFTQARLDDLRLKGTRRAQTFSWDACAAQTARIYNNLL